MSGLQEGYNTGYTSIMKTAISIPDPVFQAADELAHKLGMSRSELYTTAVRSFVETHESRDITAALDRIYAEEDSSLDPFLAALQYSALPREEW
jgi:metal-responsive CopG/Arc/MetJ family transcriptional regulator